MTKLSNYRFSLLNMTLADECVEVAVKSIGKLTKQAAGKTADIDKQIKSIRKLLNDVHNEVIGLIDATCCDPASMRLRKVAILAGQQPQRQAVIDAIIADFDSVRSPDNQYSIQASDDLRNKWYYQLAEGGYALITGDWENWRLKDETRAQFLMESLLLTCTDGKIEPFTIDDLLGMGQDITTLIPGEAWTAILEACGATKYGVNGDTFGPLANQSASVLNNIVNYINQIRVVSAMDKDAALSMAQSYIDSDNQCMQSVGNLVKTMVEGGPVTTALILTKQAGEEIGKDAWTTAAYDAVMYAVGCASGPLSYAIGATGVATDFLMNTGDAAQLSNNMAYSSEMARAAYSSFERDYAAYKDNPTEANLSKAMDSYNTYNRAMAVSYESYSAYAENTTDSIIGKNTIDGVTQNADELADNSADRCRYRVSRMQEYQKKLGL